MKKSIFVLLSTTLMLNIVPESTLACSDLLLNNSGLSFFSADAIQFGFRNLAFQSSMPRLISAQFDPTLA